MVPEPLRNSAVPAAMSMVPPLRFTVKRWAVGGDAGGDDEIAAAEGDGGRWGSPRLESKETESVPPLMVVPPV